MRATTLRSALLSAAACLALAGPASAQGGAGGPGGGGQGGLSPDTPTLAPVQPGVNGGGGPRTPLPPRDTPRAPQPGQDAGREAGGGDGPKTPLPPRDTPRAQQPGGGRAAAPKDPNWPCVQPKVAALSYGQMWAGPSLESAAGWRDDADLVDLVGVLVARRTSLDEAKTRIADFAKAAGDKRDARLTALFAGVFEEINAQRSRIMTGIERYARKQRDLSDKIKDESLKLASEQQDMASQNTPEAMQKQQALTWDTRIYDERQHSLNYVCESPVLYEQRAFELGRAIQAELSQNAQ